VISNPSFSERRTHARAEKNIPVKISYGEGDAVTETFNISRSGAYCCVKGAIEPMTKLKIQLLVPVLKSGKLESKKVSCEGVVVRSEPAEKEGFYNIAIFFSDISPANISILKNYMQYSLED